MRKDVIVVGLALFAIFFGAGNLIFPPLLGLISGDDWLVGTLGFLLSDTTLALLGIIAVAIVPGGFDGLGNKVGPVFSKVLGVTIMLTLGPLLALPRTGAVTHEMGILPLLSSAPLWLVTGLYFLGSMVFVFDQKGVMDKIGKWLTPALLLSLLAIIVAGIFFPISDPLPASIPSVFGNGFISGYQTVDGICSIILARIIVNTLEEKGYVKARQKVIMTILSGIIAMGLISLVYTGLIYLGASSVSIAPADVSRTGLFVLIVNNLLGSAGTVMISIAVILACFTTAIGLTATTGAYFYHISKGKVSYKFTVVAVTIISLLIANLGVESIVRFSGPVLMMLYPPVIILILSALIDRFALSRVYYRTAVYTALLMSVPAMLSAFGFPLSGMDHVLARLPLASYELGWLLPSFALGFAAEMLFRLLIRPRQNRLAVS
ncbi:MAG: branched-chain amino acid transport system II carrier protein [Bacteroidales bacterium]|nr:branched-chain amino acid transport system II carrier protein [Bacteroidales bacterium]